MKKKLWKDPVWSSVIAAGIIALAATVLGSLGGWLPNVSVLVKGFAAFLGERTQIPNWVLIFGGSWFCFFVITRLKRWIRLRSQPTAYAYKKDEFFGLIWRWDYGFGGQIINTATFCPCCDLQIDPVDISAYRAAGPNLGFRCTKCCFQSETFRDSVNGLHVMAEREIQLRLRSGAWREAVQGVVA